MAHAQPGGLGDGRGADFPVLSREFRHWLAGRFYEFNGEPASGYKLEELVSASAAEALFKGPEYRVHLRMAREGGAIWLDLADAEGRAVRAGRDASAIGPAGEVTPKF